MLETHACFVFAIQTTRYWAICLFAMHAHKCRSSSQNFKGTVRLSKIMWSTLLRQKQQNKEANFANASPDDYWKTISLGYNRAQSFWNPSYETLLFSFFACLVWQKTTLREPLQEILPSCLLTPFNHYMPTTHQVPTSKTSNFRVAFDQQVYFSFLCTLFVPTQRKLKASYKQACDAYIGVSGNRSRFSTCESRLMYLLPFNSDDKSSLLRNDIHIHIFFVTFEICPMM